MVCILLMYMEDGQHFWNYYYCFFTNRNTNNLDWKGQKEEWLWVWPRDHASGRLWQAQRVKRPVTEDYSQALKPNGTSPAELWTCFAPVNTLFFPCSSFQNKNICCRLAPPYFGSRQFVFQFYMSTAKEEFYPRIDHTQSLNHTWRQMMGFGTLWVLIWDVVLIQE